MTIETTGIIEIFNTMMENQMEKKMENEMEAELAMKHVALGVQCIVSHPWKLLSSLKAPRSVQDQGPTWLISYSLTLDFFKHSPLPKV